ncbi:MAG: hypothetical protein KDD22_00160 [Bdellovibrionales bacterium]|nr:hypothetical protein [Bdellovibrionales bacterium]
MTSQIIEAKSLGACEKYHLKIKSCLLKGGGIRLQVTESRFSIFDGVWRELLPFPFAGEKVEWVSMELLKLGDRNFLDLKFWDKPSGIAEIQSMRWVGYEIKDLKLEPAWYTTLQKRRLKAPSSQNEDERRRGHLPPSLKPLFIYDKAMTHSLDLNKQGEIHIKVGHKEWSEEQLKQDFPNLTDVQKEEPAALGKSSKKE